MKFIDQKLNKKELKEIQKKFGSYVKLTVDLERELIVAGQRLHADAEKLLLEKGSEQGNIWGGGINLKDKIIDTTAVMNIRPRQNNDNMEILDSGKRSKFEKIVKKFFMNHDIK